MAVSKAYFKVLYIQYIMQPNGTHLVSIHTSLVPLFTVSISCVTMNIVFKLTSVADPDPNPDLPDPHVLGPPGSGSGSISQRHGSAYPDPDPHQNVMDPHH